MDDMTRRGALAGAAAGLLIVKPEIAFGFQANSAVALGIIGTGNRGRYDGIIFAKDARARVTAICDVQPQAIDMAKTLIPGADKARVYKDHQELLAAADIDAVLIATPIFLHPEHFEHAVNARKHIYCEKAAGADVAGVKRLMRAGERAGKSTHIQFGFQQRYSPEYLAAEKIISSGQLGDLILMRSHWMSGGQVQPAEPKPAYSSLAEEKLRNWYRWKETSGDYIVEQNCHGVDVLNWYTKSHPLLASGAGGQKVRPYGDCNDHANITFEYAKGLRGFLHSCQLAQGWTLVNEQFFGTTGTIETHRQYYRWYRPAAQRGGVVPPLQEVKSKREITIDAVEHFLEHIVSAKPENNTLDAAESTLTALLGRMAVETRRVVTWDEMMQWG